MRSTFDPWNQLLRIMELGSYLQDRERERDCLWRRKCRIGLKHLSLKRHQPGFRLSSPVARFVGAGGIGSGCLKHAIPRLARVCSSVHGLFRDHERVSCHHASVQQVPYPGVVRDSTQEWLIRTSSQSHRTGCEPAQKFGIRPEVNPQTAVTAIGCCRRMSGGGQYPSETGIVLAKTTNGKHGG